MIPENTALLVFVGTLITSCLLTKFIEPAGGLLKPKWYSNYRPPVTGLIALSLMTAVLAIGVLILKGGALSWAKSQPGVLPQGTGPLLTLVALGITCGIIASGVLQDLKTKTVPSLSIVLAGIPAVLILNGLAKGPEILKGLAWTTVEMLVIWGIVALWEFYQWKHKGVTTELETPKEFEIYRKHAKWTASVDREDEVPWAELCPSGIRAGIIAITPEGDEIHGYKNTVVVKKANGGDSSYILDQRKEDFSFQVKSVKIPKQAMGRGDLHLACLIGLTLGPGTTAFTITLGGVITMVSAFIAKKDLRAEHPMIPGMAIAFFIALYLQPHFRTFSESISLLLPQ